MSAKRKKFSKRTFLLTLMLLVMPVGFEVVGGGNDQVPVLANSVACGVGKPCCFKLHRHCIKLDGEMVQDHHDCNSVN